MNAVVTGSDAVISPCRLYRYLLTRTFEGGEGSCLFIDAAPTYADAQVDDAIASRCVAFAAHQGFHDMKLASTFAWRCASPGVLAHIPDPVGPENDRWLLQAAEPASKIIAIWGRDAQLHGRDALVLAMLRERGLTVHHLGLSKGRYPRHPLRVSKRAPIWRWEEGA